MRSIVNIYIYIYIAIDFCHYSTLPMYLVGFFLIKFLTLLIKNTVHIHEQDEYLRYKNWTANFDCIRCQNFSLKTDSF